MTEIGSLVRWNTNFVRGLAQSVLERARAIRSTLTSTVAVPPQRTKPKRAAKKKTARKSAARRTRRKSNG